MVQSSRMDKSRIIKYRQLLCVLPMCCLYFMIGLTRGWVAPILEQANDPHAELPLTSEQSSWMASMNYLSRGLSPIFSCLLLERMGRSTVSVCNAVVFFVIWIPVYWSRNILVHYAVRLVCGLIDGVHPIVGNVYVCENCSPQYRGVFVSLLLLFLFAGHLAVFVLAGYCSYGHMTIACGGFGFVTLLSTLLLVEPPHYLLTKGRAERAEKHFSRLRDMNDPNSVKEFEGIKRNMEEEKSRVFNLTLFRAQEVVRGLRVLLITMFLVGECGYPAMTAFVTKLFSDSDGSSMTQHHLSMAYGFLQLVSVCASASLMERFDRRHLMLLSCVLTALIHAGLFILYRLQHSYEIPCFKLILFTMLTMFACVSSMFSFPLCGLIRGELLPQSVKMMGLGLSTCLLSLSSFINSRTFLPIAETFGLEMNFAIFSCAAMMMAVYEYCDLPETRGKTLVEIQDELKGIKGGERESSRL